jgi:NAD(P)-dependent dehydrogenase (short-subunit alcohol dehydrogenase family)
MKINFYYYDPNTFNHFFMLVPLLNATIQDIKCITDYQCDIAIFGLSTNQIELTIKKQIIAKKYIIYIEGLIGNRLLNVSTLDFDHVFVASNKLYQSLKHIYNNVINIGDTFYNYIDQNKVTINDKNNTITFFLSPDDPIMDQQLVNNKYYETVLPAIINLTTNYNVIFKAHPRSSATFLKFLKKFDIYIDTHLTISELIKKSKLTMSFGSTCSFESIINGVPSCFINLENKLTTLYNLFECDDIDIITDEQEFMNFLDNPKIKINFIENHMNSIETFVNFIKNIKKVVLITGSSGGIGNELCHKFKSNNWYVIGTDIVPTKNNVDEYIYSDLSNSDSIINLVNEIIKTKNQIDCIVNNAGLQICKSIWEIEIDEWDKIYSCNVKSIFLLTKYLLPLLKKTKGNIVNIGSVHGTQTSNKIACYASSKSAIVGLTRNLAIELSQFGIRVNCVSPGAIDTPMLHDGLNRNRLNNDPLDDLKNKHLLKQIGKPYEIANLVYFIVEGDVNFIDGANILIDGGVTIKLSSE